MIELEGICAGYDGREVLRDVSLSVNSGELVALIGPNGCGKSTLIKTAAGQMPPVRGCVRLDGRALDSLGRREAAKRLSYLAQSREASGMTVGELVLSGRYPYAAWPCRYSDADREIARQAMHRMGVYDMRARLLSDISGGERQKARVAMALAQQAGTLLMDEPTTFLDIRHRIELMRLLRTLCREGCAALTVLHDMELALEYSDRVAVMSEGALLACGAPGDRALDAAIERAFGVRVERLRDARGKVRYAFSATEGD